MELKVKESSKTDTHVLLVVYNSTGDIICDRHIRLEDWIEDPETMSLKLATYAHGLIESRNIEEARIVIDNPKQYVVDTETKTVSETVSEEKKG